MQLKMVVCFETVEDGCLYGKVTGIKSLLSYEGDSVQELERDFQYVIDDYLEECRERSIGKAYMRQLEKDWLAGKGLPLKNRRLSVSRLICSIIL